MIKIEQIDVWGFEHAIRGMRNPLNIGDKSDSQNRFFPIEVVSATGYVEDKYNTHHDIQAVDIVTKVDNKDNYEVVYGIMAEVGPNDLELMKKLYRSGSEHRKFLQQIMVSMDITAPLYYWKEFDTYKIGTTQNSCSIIHDVIAKPFELSDFSHEHLYGNYLKDSIRATIGYLNTARDTYLKTKDKNLWWQVIQLLPISYNQKRTITLNYENVITMIHQGTNTKLDEWKEFVDVLIKLPYVEDIING